MSQKKNDTENENKIQSILDQISENISGISEEILNIEDQLDVAVDGEIEELEKRKDQLISKTSDLELKYLEFSFKKIELDQIENREDSKKVLERILIFLTIATTFASIGSVCVGYAANRLSKVGLGFAEIESRYAHSETMEMYRQSKEMCDPLLKKESLEKIDEIQKLNKKIMILERKVNLRFEDLNKEVK